MPFEPFFPPSSEITCKLIRRIGERRATILRAALSEQRGHESAGSDELATSILDALETDTDNDAEADWEDQRWLREVLYNFMGLRAGRIRRGVEIDEITLNDIVEGMRDGLGLYQHEDRPLLEELADEFSSWLADQNNYYVAGWGTIVRDRYDTFRLRPLTKPGAETEELPTEIFERRATAAQGGVSANLDLIER